jgi:hypothetical protein
MLPEVALLSSEGTFPLLAQSVYIVEADWCFAKLQQRVLL